MSPMKDPEKTEARYLIKAAQFPGKRVLEIGCGNTDFMQQYAGNARAAFGIDPSFSNLQAARSSNSASRTNVSIALAKGEALPFPDDAFEIAILASSL